MSVSQQAAKLAHRIPLIKFKYGLRPNESVVHESPKVVQQTVQMKPSLEFFELPKKYQRRPITQEEMEAINKGGF